MADAEDKAKKELAKALRTVLRWILKMAEAELNAAPSAQVAAPPPPAPATPPPGPGPNPPEKKAEPKPEEKKSAVPDEAATARQKLFAVISLIEKDKVKGKAIYKALTGLEKAHDLDVKGLTSLTSALYEVKSGIAAIIPFENGRAAIIRKTDNVVLFGTVPPKSVMPTSAPATSMESDEPF